MADLGVERVVDIYTDGACSGNPGPGGWGALLRYGTHEKEICGGEAVATTNNRMELMAPIRALESLTRSAVVRVHTDSTYVRNGVTKWLQRWKSSGWQTVEKQPVKNADLWRRLDAALGRHQVQWYWVKGHAGHAENERADQLAAKGLREARAAGTGSPGPVPKDRRVAPQARIAVEAAGAVGAAGVGGVGGVGGVRGVGGVGGAGDDAGAARRCRMTTRTGQPCPITARPSGLCHVHDPAVQCGAVKRNGERCTVATGGGRCAVHRSANTSAV